MHSRLLVELWRRLPAALTGWLFCGVIGLASVLGGGGNTVARVGGMCAAAAGTVLVLALWGRAGSRAAAGDPGDARAIRCGSCPRCGHERGPSRRCHECGYTAPRVTP